MEGVEEISQKMVAHFDGVWSQGDVWDFESSDYERRKYERQIELIRDRHYGRALELGCGAGVFSRMLAPHADQLLAVDVAPSAIERAKKSAPVPGNVEFRAEDVMKLDLHAQGPWDLVTMSETACCLGWLYSCFQLGWFASDLLASQAVGGRFLMANTYNAQRKDYLLRPYLINTYRDLFLRVGYELEHEEKLKGEKHGMNFTALISLYRKTKPSLGPDEYEPVED